MPSAQLKDHYQTLGVSRTASDKELKSAFRKLARQYHPDANQGDPAAEERFKDINEAFEVLSDEKTRKLYDRYGDDWRAYRDAGYTGDEPPPRPGGSGGRFTSTGGGGTRVEYEFGGGDLGSIFGDVFSRQGGGFRSSRSTGFAPGPTRGSDIEQPIDVSFDEAFRGTERRFEIQSPEVCPTCGGDGLARGAICPRCDGAGTIQRGRTIEVSIPAGVVSGQRIRVKGQGSPGRNGGPAGDVFLIVTVRPDPRFEREGANLRSRVEVPLYDAILGGEVTVPTPTSRVALSIPAGTQNGRVFRLRGQGMPRLKKAGERGDLLAEVSVVLPTDLSARERELFEQLRDHQA
jgi:DnaJ-class molecular chaperone